MIHRNEGLVHRNKTISPELVGMFGLSILKNETMEIYLKSTYKDQWVFLRKNGKMTERMEVCLGDQVYISSELKDDTIDQELVSAIKYLEYADFIDREEFRQVYAEAISQITRHFDNNKPFPNQ